MDVSGVTIDETPIETPGEFWTSKPYHASLRVVYENIRSEMDRETSDAEHLSMEVFPENSTVGPEGLCTIFIVFGDIPTPARKINNLTNMKRERSIESVIFKVERQQAKHRIEFGRRNF